MELSAELWAQVDGEKERLFVLMEQVQKKLQKKSEGRAVTADLRCCKWDQVMQEVDRTADGWTAASKKSSKVAAHLDKIKQNAAAFESWLELLPTGDYGSSICGVFRLVLAVSLPPINSRIPLLCADMYLGRRASCQSRADCL